MREIRWWWKLEQVEAAFDGRRRVRCLASYARSGQGCVSYTSRECPDW